MNDTTSNSLWVADAKLFKTLATASGDPAAFVDKIIAAAGGVIDDTPCQWDTPAYSGHYVLTESDFAPGSGHLNWYGAQAFIAYLNSIRYLGYSDWRQPVTLVPFGGFLTIGTGAGDVAPGSGELAELFYTELGARVTPGDYLHSVNGYAALFHHLQDSYFYATEGNADPGTAGLFLFGFSVEHVKIGGNKDPAFAWPMRVGQASVRDLLAAVIKNVEPTDDQMPLAEAGELLRHSCDDIDKFLREAPRSKKPLEHADVEAIGKVIGCR